MTQPNLPSKAELLEALRASGRVVVERLRELPAQVLEEGRYENGWNGRQILAHVASIEWTYPRLIDLARQAATPPAAKQTAEVRRTSAEEAADLPGRPARGGIDDYNHRQVEKRAAASVEALIAEFEANRAATVAALEAVDEELLRTPIRSAGGITGPLVGVIQAIAVEHVRGHLSDIVGEAGEGRRW